MRVSFLVAWSSIFADIRRSHENVHIPCRFFPSPVQTSAVHIELIDLHIENTFAGTKNHSGEKFALKSPNLIRFRRYSKSFEVSKAEAATQKDTFRSLPSKVIYFNSRLFLQVLPSKVFWISTTLRLRQFKLIRIFLLNIFQIKLTVTYDNVMICKMITLISYISGLSFLLIKCLRVVEIQNTFLTFSTKSETTAPFKARFNFQPFHVVCATQDAVLAIDINS